MYAEIRTRIPDTISWDYHFEHAGNTPVTFTVKVLQVLPLFIWWQYASIEALTFMHSMIHPLQFYSLLSWKNRSRTLSGQVPAFRFKCNQTPLRYYSKVKVMVTCRYDKFVSIHYLASHWIPDSLLATPLGRLSSPTMQIQIFSLHSNVTMKHHTGKLCCLKSSESLTVCCFVLTILFSARYKYKFLRATTSNFPNSIVKENRGSKVTIGRGGMLKIQHLVSVARPGMQNFRNVAGGAQQPSRIAYIEFFVKPEEYEINDA